MIALELIANERKRQIEKGFIPEHDDLHTHGELAQAATVYADAALRTACGGVLEFFADDYANSEETDIIWPWLEYRDNQFQLKGLNIDADPISSCVKAGALLVAEIERLQRLQIGAKVSSKESSKFTGDASSRPGSRDRAHR